MNGYKTCLGCADILGIELGRLRCTSQGDKTTHIYIMKDMHLYIVKTRDSNTVHVA